jgi:hypothetical protein
MEEATWRRPCTAFFANKRSLFMGRARYFEVYRSFDCVQTLCSFGFTAALASLMQ